MIVPGSSSPLIPVPPSVRPQPAPRAEGPNAPGTAARALTGEPSLWELLTPEEREFFSQQAALGPLTYRPGSTAPESLPAPTGRRIDVRG